MQVKKQQFELDVEQQTGSKSGKEYIKAVYCHPAYLSYTQSTSCEMLGWMNHKLESRLKEKYQQPQVSTASDDSTLLAHNEEGLKSLWMIVKEKSEKPGLKFNIPKTKIMASSPIRSDQIRHSVVSDSLRPHESLRGK